MLGNDLLVNINGLQETQTGAFNLNLNNISGKIAVGLYALTDSAAVIGPISFLGLMGNPTNQNKNLLTPVALIAGHSYAI